MSFRFINTEYDFTNITKGFNGSVLIIGGCDLYTGAPYSAAMSSLLCGSDLVYIFTQEDALLPLKVLLPEAVVCLIKYEEWILKRVNVCVFGSGLGKVDETTLDTLRRIFRYFNNTGIYIIIDGDGFRILSGLDIDGNVIYTPNINEARRFPPLKIGQYAIFKGVKDKIVSYDGTIVEVDDEPCGKRCGGQGDLLCGILATLIIKINGDTINEGAKKEAIMNSMTLASKILRLAGARAFKKRGISTIQRDIIKEIPESINDILLIKESKDI